MQAGKLRKSSIDRIMDLSSRINPADSRETRAMFILASPLCNNAMLKVPRTLKSLEPGIKLPLNFSFSMPWRFRQWRRRWRNLDGWIAILFWRGFRKSLRIVFDFDLEADINGLTFCSMIHMITALVNLLEILKREVVNIVSSYSATTISWPDYDRSALQIVVAEIFKLCLDSIIYAGLNKAQISVTA